MVKILILVVLILVVTYVIAGMALIARRRKQRAARKRDVAAILARAERQQELFLAGDPRGLYGDYLPPEEFLPESVTDAERVIHPEPEPVPIRQPPKTFTLPVPAGSYSALRFPASDGTVPFSSPITLTASGEIVVTVPDELAPLAVGDPELVGNGTAYTLSSLLSLRNGEARPRAAEHAARRRAAEQARAAGISNVMPGTVVETWGGDVIRTLQDKIRDTLSVTEAQQMLDEAKNMSSTEAQEIRDEASRKRVIAEVRQGRFSALELSGAEEPAPPKKRAPRKRAAAAKKPPPEQEAQGA